MPQEAARRIISTPSPAQSQGGSHKKFPPSGNTGNRGRMGAWLVGAHQQPQVSPMGARSRFQRWPHARLPHPCQQQGHRRDVPCWNCASGTQQCGQTGHPAIPPAIFWLIAVPTNTPSPERAGHWMFTTTSFFGQKQGTGQCHDVLGPCSIPAPRPSGTCTAPGCHRSPPAAGCPQSPVPPRRHPGGPALLATGRVAMEKISVPPATQRKLRLPWDAALMRRRRRRAGKGLARFLSFALYFLQEETILKKKKRQTRKRRGVGGARPLPCQMTEPSAAERDLCVCSCPCIEAPLGDGSKAEHLLKEPKQQVTSRAACPSLVSQPPVPREGLHLHPALLGATRLPLGSTVGSWGYMASKTPHFPLLSPSTASSKHAPLLPCLFLYLSRKPAPREAHLVAHRSLVPHLPSAVPTSQGIAGHPGHCSAAPPPLQPTQLHKFSFAP